MLLKLRPESKRPCCSLWPRVAKTFGLASNRWVKPELKTKWKAGFEESETSMTPSCRLNCWQLRQRGSFPASTFRLSIGEVRKASKQVCGAVRRHGDNRDSPELRVKQNRTPHIQSLALTWRALGSAWVVWCSLLLSPCVHRCVTGSGPSIIRLDWDTWFGYRMWVSCQKSKPRNCVSVTTGIIVLHSLRPGSHEWSFGSRTSYKRFWI